MSCYLIGHIEINDPDRYGDYAAAVLSQLEPVGARVLAAGPVKLLEGRPMPNHNVIIEFPDEVAALAWYQSNEYQAVLPVRIEASEFSQIALVKAWDDRD